MACQTKKDEKINFDKVTDTPVFNQITQSKLGVISYSLERQLKGISNRLESEKVSGKEQELIPFIDSLSLELDSMRNEFIHHSGGYKENTGGMMYPLSKSGTGNYFYGENEFDSFSFRHFDKIIEILQTKFYRYLHCESQSIFNFQDINFYKEQEPKLNKPNEFLLKNKSTIEVLQVIQILKIQLEILKLKVQLDYMC